MLAIPGPYLLRHFFCHPVEFLLFGGAFAFSPVYIMPPYIPIGISMYTEKNAWFDAVYSASTLELFDTPDIPRVLAEIKRVLKSSGRLGIISMPKEGHEDSMVLRFYEWIHRTFPKYASCRPIYVEDLVRDTEFEIMEAEEMMMARLFPMKIVMARQ